MGEVKAIDLAFVAYPVTDVARARKFYEGTLGLVESMSFSDENGSWTEYNIGSGTIGLGSANEVGWKPGSGGGCAAIEVTDFESAMEKIKEDGVPVVYGPMDMEKTVTAVVSDPDGNSVIILYRKS